MANAITQDTDHATEATTQLPTQYVDAAVMHAFAQTIGERAQLVEDWFWAILTESLPSSASTVGAQLDKFGALIGQARAGGDYPAGESDTLYRAKLDAAARRNRSAGTGEDLLGILSTLLGGNLIVVALMDTPPAAFTAVVLTWNALTTAEQAMVRGFVDRSRGAGIGAKIAIGDDVIFGFGATATYPWIGQFGQKWATFI